MGTGTQVDAVELHEITHFDRHSVTIYNNTPPESEIDPDNLSSIVNHSLSVADVLFNAVVVFILVVELCCNCALVIVHYNYGEVWGCGITALVMLVGAVALINGFWMIPRDQLSRVYTNGNGTRLCVNSFPLFAPIITSFQVMTSCNESQTNPMVMHRFVKLDALAGSFLKIQSLWMSAPQAFVQLVLLLEAAENIDVVRAILCSLTVVTSLITMTVANLPSKWVTIGDNEIIPKAAYIPISRVFIGLRMISSFGSRILSVSVFTSAFRCGYATWTSSNLPAVQHTIPMSVLLVPRLTFSVVHYIYKRYRGNRESYNGILLGYIASVFFLFGEPAWMFFYGCGETILFMVFGAVVVGLWDCFSIAISVTCGLTFFSLFLLVPCVLPYVTERIK